MKKLQWQAVDKGWRTKCGSWRIEREGNTAQFQLLMRDGDYWLETGADSRSVTYLKGQATRRNNALIEMW